MLIHFAFGAEKDNLNKQASLFIDNILKPKKLKISNNPEFLPSIPQKETIGGFRFDPRDAQLVTSNTLSINPHSPTKPATLITIKENDISYFPEDVHMVCFIDIPFNKLKSSSHHVNYGKLGIAFNNNFKKNNNIKPVYYYTEKNLHDDPLIRRWNALSKKQNKMSEDLKELEKLKNEITSFRKPAYLWENFGKSQSIILNISSDGINTELKFITYDRYPLGYNFQNEHEHRMTLDKTYNQKFLDFEETDILFIIVPNADIGNIIKHSLSSTYSLMPEIKIFPN